MVERIHNSILNLIGNTPIVKLNSIGSSTKSEILVKLESFNPMSSVKDRIAKAMIETAENNGNLKKGMTIVEPTSGNTGIGLAMVAAAKGYRIILTMPDTMSAERRNILSAFGAELELTPGAAGMPGAIEKAIEIVRNDPTHFYMPQQFENLANPQVHIDTTAREILEATEGKLDYFVAGVGTGGTITGVGKVLKQEMPATRIIAVEPEDSPVLSNGEKGPHKIQGIGAGFVPNVLDRTVIDEIQTVSYEDAVSTARLLARKEGILCGISSGAALAIAVMIANTRDDAGRILALLPDTGERYLSTNLFSDN